MKNWISTNEKQRFALKKIAGKTVSVLIGTTLFGFYLGTKTEVHVVKADTITDVSTKLEQAKPETTPEVDTKSAINEASDNVAKDAVQTTDTTNNKEQSATLATPIKSLAPTVASNKTSEVSDSLKVPTEKTTEPTSNLNTENNQKDAVQTTDTTNNKEQSATLATPIKSLAPTVASNKTSEVSDSLKVPTEKTTEPTSNLNTENNQNVKNFLAASLVSASSTRSLATKSYFNALKMIKLVSASSIRSPATDQEAELPKSDQVFELQDTSIYNDLVSTESLKGKEATWLWKVINSYWHPEKGYDAIKETLNDANLYYFAVFADYSNSDHNFILVARDKNDLDNPTITAKIVDFYRGVNTETLTVAANSSQTSTESTKGRYTIQNFGNGSYSVTLNTGTNPYGLLPVIDRGLLNPDLAGKSKDEYDAIAKSKSISSYSSYIPKRRTQLIRYVDRATGKDLVQPIKIRGYGNQLYRTNDITPPNC